MKDIRIIAMLMLSLFFLSTSVFSRNLITNNGFEDADNQGRAIGWIDVNHAAVVDSSTSFLGNRSMHMSIADTGNIRFDQYVEEINGGATYYFSCWVLTSGDSKKAYARLKIEWLDRNNKYVSGNNSPPLMFSTSEEWRKLSCQVKAPPEAVKARLLFRLFGPGEAWYDEAYFSEEPEPAIQVDIARKEIFLGDIIEIEMISSESIAEPVRWSLIRGKTMLNGEFSSLSQGKSRFTISLPEKLEGGTYCLDVFTEGKEKRTLFSEEIFVKEHPLKILLIP